MSFRRNLLFLATLATIGSGAAYALVRGSTPITPTVSATESAITQGGDVGIRWNRELAGDLGIRIQPAAGASQGKDGSEHFALQPAQTLRFGVRSGYVREFSGGSLQARGGFVLALRKGQLDLSGFRLIPRQNGKYRTALAFDLVGADGIAWFQVDRIMHELREDGSLSVPTSDLRISRRLAQRLGMPEVAGWTIGEVQLQLPAHSTTGARTANAALAGGIHWAGYPAPDGGTYQNDLFMQQTTVQYTRCSSCTGEYGSGRVVFTPSSTLKNNVNAGSLQPTIANDPLGTSSARYTAGIPWYSKFSGNFAPYNNDQHPYLTWNMYRYNPDGSLEQIGRSGIKHAFLTTNGECLDTDDHDSHILGRGCVDTYSTSHNDSNNGLSPRSELLPATGQWGRCGSSFDTNCDGTANASPATDNFYQRLIVNESQIAPSRNNGANWLFESWYLARGDINIYNSMSTKQITHRWTGSAWSVNEIQEKLGAAIDHWFAADALPASNKKNQELVVDGAHAKVAVKAFNLGNGYWRYHYAVMNFDFTFAQTSGTEPNLRIVSNQGFDGFALSTASAAQATDLLFRDGDLNAGNNWSFSNSGGSLKWSNVSGTASTLWWGTLYAFSFTSPKAPVAGTATLSANNAATPRQYTVATLVPGA